MADLNEKTRVPLKWVVSIALACMGKAVFDYKGQRDISEIKSMLQQNVSREEFRNWTKDLKIANPQLNVPDFSAAAATPRAPAHGDAAPVPPTALVYRKEED